MQIEDDVVTGSDLVGNDSRIEIKVSNVEFAEQLIGVLSLDELENLAVKAAEKLELLRKETKENDLAALEALAKKYGATVSWPKPKKPVRPRPNVKRKAPIKFIDPANTENKWSGRGQQPVWLKNYVSQGRSPSEFMVS